MKDTGQFATVPLVSLIQMAYLPPVSTIQAANLVFEPITKKEVYKKSRHPPYFTHQ
jgi:hypothetical protein